MTAREMSAYKPSIIDLPKRGILTSSVGSAKVRDNIYKIKFWREIRSIVVEGVLKQIFLQLDSDNRSANMGLGGLKKCEAYFMHLIGGFRFDGV